MKYCPKCGVLLQDKTECSCGFTIDVEEINNNPASPTITGNLNTGMMNPFESYELVEELKKIGTIFPDNIDKNVLIHNINKLNIMDELILEKMHMSTSEIINYCYQKINNPSSKIYSTEDKVFCEDEQEKITINKADFTILDIKIKEVEK